METKGDRVKANPFKPSLPTIILCNVWLVRNKMDEIRLQMTAQRTIYDCCCMIFCKTWENTDPALAPLASTDTAPVLCTHEVRLTIRSIDTRKAAGPNEVLGRVLQGCTAELVDIFSSTYTACRCPQHGSQPALTLP